MTISEGSQHIYVMYESGKGKDTQFGHRIMEEVGVCKWLETDRVVNYVLIPQRAPPRTTIVNGTTIEEPERTTAWHIEEIAGKWRDWMLEDYTTEELQALIDKRKKEAQ